MAGLKHYAIILFPGFQALDAFGPLDILDMLSLSQPEMHLSILAETRAPVPVKPPAREYNPNPAFSQSVMPTVTYEEMLTNGDSQIDVLIIPGGIGTRAPPGAINPTVDFVRKIEPRVKNIITVCTGAHVLAQTGLLDGKKATTNKYRFDYVASLNPGVKWIKRARWVRDGNIWTSAGISAGMDVTLAFVREHYGVDQARTLALQLEYDWREDAGEVDSFYDKYFPDEK